jgi:hypothetical protein
LDNSKREPVMATPHSSIVVPALGVVGRRGLVPVGAEPAVAGVQALDLGFGGVAVAHYRSANRS